MLDILRLCQDYRIPYLTSGHHHCHEGWIQLHCPQCAGGKAGWHLGFSLEWGNFHCWRCGSIRLTNAIGGLLNEHRVEKVWEIIQRYRKPKSRLAKKSEENWVDQVKPPPGLGPLSTPHRRYLMERGFDPDLLAAEWGLQGTQHLSGIWNWRIVYPVLNSVGKVVAYQGRTIVEGVKPKYRLTERKSMGQSPYSLVYGVHRAQKDAVVIVEGATGVWRLGPGAVAVLGIDWALPQVEVLRKYQRRYILFDPEPKAQQRAESLAKAISLFGGVTEVVTGFRTDPGELSPEDVLRIRRRLAIV